MYMYDMYGYIRIDSMKRYIYSIWIKHKETSTDDMHILDGPAVPRSKNKDYLVRLGLQVLQHLYHGLGVFQVT